jgi:hypothetical protein
MVEAAIDPTLQALEDLDTPGKYVVRRAVPIFCEHTDPITNEKWTRAKLETLARNTNRRESEEGTPMSVIIGHTPGRKEEEIIHCGYARNHRVARFGPKKKLGIICDFYLKPELYEKAMQYPHRSIERWVEDELMDPVSLLARTPQLDLGLLLPDEGPMQKTLAVNDGCELMVYARGGTRRVYQMSDAPAESPEEAPAMGDANQLMTELLDGLEAIVSKCREKLSGGETPEVPAAETNPEVQTYGAMPSGTNTHMADLITYSKEQYESLRADLEQAQLERDEARRLYQRQGRQTALAALKAEGVLLDVETELADTDTLDEAGFEKHTAKIKKCYQRTGKVSSGFIPTDDADKTAGSESDEATEYAKLRPLVVAYAREHKCSTFDAFAAVKAQQQGK